MNNEKTIELMAKMYQARRNLKTLFGEERFYQRVEESRPLIKALALKMDGSEIKATMGIIKTMQEKGTDPVLQMLALAACVEIVEPSREMSKVKA